MQPNNTATSNMTVVEPCAGMETWVCILCSSKPSPESNAACTETTVLSKHNQSFERSAGNREEGVVLVPCMWRHHATSSTAISHSPCVMIPTSLRTRSMPFFSWSSFTTMAFNNMSVLIIVLVRK